MLKKVWRFSKPTGHNIRRFLSNVSLHTVDREGIELSWDDGRKDYYHGIWLRHNCHCPFCVSDHSGQKIVEPIELVNSCITKASIQGGTG